MANVPSTSTYLSDLFNPQVVGDLIDKKLIDAIKFAPLAKVDTSLSGRPGSILTMPFYSYIGNASTVAEGADIDITKLTESTVHVEVHKIAKGLQFTDESVLSGYGDPIGEGVRQIQMAIASQVDNEMLATLRAIPASAGTDVYGNTVAAGLVYTCSTAGSLTADDIADALVKFGEDIEGDKVLVVSPKMYSAIRKADDWCPASEIAAQLVIKGAVGMIHGCQVVISNKITDYDGSNRGEAFIVKPGALALYLKRDTEVETDRDIINKSTVMTADKHFCTYVYDPSKAIRVVV